MQKYRIITYGCQMNVHESEKIAGILTKLGYGEAAEGEDADVVVFNTCCIRDNAERKAAGHIGMIKTEKKKNPSMIVAVVGCMTQQSGKAMALREKFPFIDIVLGTSNLAMLETYIPQVAASREKFVDIDANERPEVRENESFYRTSGTNAWLNIMYGCNNFCTYCIVPYVRGRERSRTKEAIKDEFMRLVDEGYPEITLLGQNVNSYGKDLYDGEYGFADLLEELAKTDGKRRIRFMTSHPKDFNRKLIDVIAEYPNICNNIHLPVQSGSNKILKLMNRHYTREYYLDTIAAIREKLPDCGITTDLMVGFPYEEESDFLDTMDIVEKVRYSNAFTFVYSMRNGTPAASMPQVDPEVAKDRIMRLIAKQNSITKELSKGYENKVFEVLCEDLSPSKIGFVCGRTDSGRLVTFPGDENLIGKFCDVRITRSQSASLFGETEV